MTRLDPSLFVLRLVVYQGEAVAYDQRFHLGLNIIRGTNSSGKSTVADLIAFGLGGDIANWKEEASWCTEVNLEVQVNGATLSLKRTLSDTHRHSMGIAWGSLDTTLRDTRAWKYYPYAQTDSKSSFSSEIFSALGISETRGEFAAKITMHQLLRLAYVDQMTSAAQIFRAERFDAELLRDALGAFVCGVYDSEYYELELKLRNLSARSEELKGQIRAEERLLGEYADPRFARKRLSKATSDQSLLISEIDESRTKRWTPGRLEARQRKDAEQLRKDVSKIEAEIMDLSEHARQVETEIADSDLFIVAINSHLDSLDESAVVYEALGEAQFNFCPACYSHLSRSAKANECYLCLQQTSEGPGTTPISRRRSELAQQLAESVKLQAVRRNRLAEISSRLSDVVTVGKKFRRQYARSAIDSAPEPDSIAQELSRKLGYIERESEELERKLRASDNLVALRAEADELTSVILDLERNRAENESTRKERQLTAQVSISQNVIRVLSRDLPREETFVAARNVQFDFGKDVVFVDGRKSFSASSMVYLKNSFHLALLISSVELEFFRYPRFLLLDNTEDKGMNVARSHNFQEIMAEWSSGAQIEHQIIITTSEISPNLESPNYTIGDFYMVGNKSLKVHRPEKISS